MPAGGLGTLMEVVNIEKLDDGRIIVKAIGLCKLEIGKQTSASPYPVSTNHASGGHVRRLCPCPRLNALPCDPLETASSCACKSTNVFDIPGKK